MRTLREKGFTVANQKEVLYEVYHPEAGEPAPCFKTWEKALAMQVRWNKIVPGHRARKRRI